MLGALWPKWRHHSATALALRFDPYAKYHMPWRSLPRVTGRHSGANAAGRQNCDLGARSVEAGIGFAGGVIRGRLERRPAGFERVERAAHPAEHVGFAEQ